MLYAWHAEGDGLAQAPPGAALDTPLWIDLYRPLPEQTAAVRALGVPVPSLEEMREIELSSRLSKVGRCLAMIAVLPGRTVEGRPTAGPVAFLLSPERLVTLRYHVPASFETYPKRAATTTAGCAGPAHVFLGLAEEIVGRFADILEDAGRTLEDIAARLFAEDRPAPERQLRRDLAGAGAVGMRVATVRHAMLTLERALRYAEAEISQGADGAALGALLAEQLRDIRALEEHVDYLSGRVTLSTDATLGLINLEQSASVRILTVVTSLFVPPTLIASIYGMNFAAMPELAAPWGYPAALAGMAVSAAASLALFRWKGWMR